MPRTPIPAWIHEPLGAVLGTRSKVAALRVLTTAGAPISQREVARRARVAYRATQLALGDLVAVGIVRRIEGGRDYAVALNDAHRLAPALRALFSADAAFFTELRHHLVAIGRDASGRGLSGLALFGSVARAEEWLDSDLDLLIVGRDQATTDRSLDAYLAASAGVRDCFGVRLKPIAYPLASARRLWRAGRAPWRELARDAVVLLGPPLAELLT